jgi:hypothetical protein
VRFRVQYFNLILKKIHGYNLVREVQEPRVVVQARSPGPISSSKAVGSQ